MKRLFVAAILSCAAAFAQASEFSGTVLAVRTNPSQVTPGNVRVSIQTSATTGCATGGWYAFDRPGDATQQSWSAILQAAVAQNGRVHIAGTGACDNYQVETVSFIDLLAKGLQHSPPWLSLPAGAGSALETAAYYANTPILVGEGCKRGPESLSDLWWCTPGIAGAPATLPEWAQQLKLPQYQVTGFNWQASFYNNDTLAMARNVRCDTVGNWFNEGVGCLVSNHGPPPDDPGFPNGNAALADAIARRNPRSFSAIWANLPMTSTTKRSIDAEAKCNGEERSPNNFAVKSDLAVHPGDIVTLGPASGSVWAGNALFGYNGPDGIGGYNCEHTIFDPEDCPMPGGPLYGLVLRRLKTLNSDGRIGDAVPHFIGSGVSTFTVAEHGQVALCINGPYTPIWDWHGYAPPADHGRFVVPVTIRRAAGVSFQVYDPSLRRSNTSHVDSEGSKQVPHSCIACHGGRWDPTTRTVIGAALLPFDVAHMRFSTQPGFTRAEQEPALAALNAMVLRTRPDPRDPNDPIAVWINGTYANGTRTTADDSFVPPGWRGDVALYRQVARPYCLTCHQAQQGTLSFNTASQFRSMATRIQATVCSTRSMPHAEATLVAFRQNNGLELIRQLLLGGGADCKP